MKKLNFPNQLSIFRIILLAPIIILLLFVNHNYNWVSQIDYNFSKIASWTFFVSGVLFAIAAFTDFLDGYLARKYHLITTLGKVLDPIADKILVNSVLIIFAYLRIVPVWIVVLMIMRDVIVNSLRIMLASQNVIMPADIWGKIKTVSQIVGILVMFFIFPLNHYLNLATFDIKLHNYWIWYLNIPILISLLCSYISGTKYLIKTLNIFNDIKKR